METPKTKLNFEQVPEALAYLIDEVAELKNYAKMQFIAEPEKRRPISIQQASKIIGKAIQTIYGLVCTKKIPYYKQGKQLYFYEDELLAYIESGRNGGKY
jgi:excisionase family DNA binding protein